MNQILIIGAGAIGSAIAKVLKKNKNNQLTLWDQDPKKTPKAVDLEEAIRAASLVFICAPSWANRQIAQQIAKAVKPSPRPAKLVISVSKGIEDKTWHTVDEILKKELKGVADWGVLAGPMIAEELAAGQPTSAVMGLSRMVWVKKVDNYFEDGNLKLEFSSDTRGLALSSSLKNIYAMGLGMADALDAKTNFKSVFTDQALAEMRTIVPLLGGQKETVYGLAGLGDLLTTGWNKESYNFSTGEKIVRQPRRKYQSEGTMALEGIGHLLGKKVSKFLLLATIKKIVDRQMAPAKLLTITDH